MKNAYDMLNRATPDGAALAAEPLNSAELNALRERVRALGVPLTESPCLRRNRPAAQNARPDAPHIIRRPRAFRRGLAALGLAAVLCAGVFAAAAGQFPWGERIADALGMDWQHAAQLGLPGETLALTKTVGEASVTLEGAVGTGRVYYFPFTVTGAPGAVLGAPDGVSFDHAFVTFADSPGAACSLYTLPDDDPSDNQLRFILCARTGDNVSGGKAQLYLHNLFAYPTETGRLHEEDAQVPGVFTFDFTLPPSAAQKVLFFSADGQDVGLPAPLTQLAFSPVGMELTLAAPPAETDGSPWDGLSLSLILRDGTARSLTDAANPAGLFCADNTILCTFPRFIDTDTVSAVEINGQRFPVEEN